MGHPRNPANTRHVVPIRLSATLLERLDAECEARIIGRTKLVELLLTYALNRLDAIDERRPQPVDPSE